MNTKRAENLMPKDAVKAWGPDKIVVSASPRQSGGIAVRFTDGTRETYPSGVLVEVADFETDPEHEGETDAERQAAVDAVLAAEADRADTKAAAMTGGTVEEVRAEREGERTIADISPEGLGQGASD